MLLQKPKVGETIIIEDDDEEVKEENREEEEEDVEEDFVPAKVKRKTPSKKVSDPDASKKRTESAVVPRPSKRQRTELKQTNVTGYFNSKR